MKYLKHILLCCSFFILLLCLIPAQAQASKYTYNIEKYDVSIRVTPQNTYEITEKLTVNFKTEHHGIYRRIPLENEVGRDDGSRSTIHARVSGIDCGEDDYSTSREGDYLVIHKSDLKDRFYKTSEALVTATNTRENKTKLFYPNSINKGWILWVLAVVVFAFAYFLPGYQYSYDWLEVGFGLMSIGVFGVSIYMLCTDTGQKLSLLIGAFLLLLSIGLSYLFVWIPVTYADRFYQFACIISYITCAILVFFSAFLTKRTPYGTEILGRIRGFKRFLETAEKERLEMLVEENPDYFYEILPYTYVLNVSDKWVKNFKSIACEPPSWYTNDNDSYFDIIAFQHIMNSTIASASNSMTSSPESASSSGGGFSGGGSGGGGGGAW